MTRDTPRGHRRVRRARQGWSAGAALLLPLLLMAGCAASEVEPQLGRTGPFEPAWVYERAFAQRRHGRWYVYGVSVVRGRFCNPALLTAVGVNRARPPIMELLGLGTSRLTDLARDTAVSVREGGQERTVQIAERMAQVRGAFRGSIGPTRLAGAWIDPESGALYLLVEARPFVADLRLPPQPEIDLASPAPVPEVIRRFVVGG